MAIFKGLTVICLLAMSYFIAGCANSEQPAGGSALVSGQAWAAAGVICNNTPLVQSAAQVNLTNYGNNTSSSSSGSGSILNVNQNSSSNSYTQNSTTVEVTGGCSQTGSPPTTTVYTNSSTSSSPTTSSSVTLTPVNSAGSSSSISGVQLSPNTIGVPVNPSSVGCGASAQNAMMIYRPIQSP